MSDVCHVPRYFHHTYPLPHQRRHDCPAGVTNLWVHWMVSYTNQSKRSVFQSYWIVGWQGATQCSKLIMPCLLSLCYFRKLFLISELASSLLLRNIAKFIKPPPTSSAGLIFEWSLSAFPVRHPRGNLMQEATVRINYKEQCKKEENVVFTKTHKTGSSTVTNILLRLVVLHFII